MMKLLRILGLLAAVIALWVVLVPPSRGGDEQDGEISRTFSFSADPETAVLVVTYSSGLSGARTVYLLYGDGRLRMEQRSRSGALRRSSETSLSFEEVQALLQTAVVHGLLDLSQKQLLAEVKRPLAVSDAGTMQVDLVVTSYERGGEAMGAQKATLRLSAPRAKHRANPDSRAIKGLVELSDRLADYQDELGTGIPR